METEGTQATAWDTETIVRELDREQEGLPEAAMRAAQQQRDLVVPALVKLIDDAASAQSAGRSPSGRGHEFALLLLAEFRAKEALPALLRTLRLPEDGADQLYGELIHEECPRILAVLMDDQPFAIDDLIADRECDVFTRWDAAATYLFFVRDFVVTRGQAMEHLAQHLRRAIDDDDGEMAMYLISDLISFGPTELRSIIEEAVEKFDLGRVFLFDDEDLRKSYDEGPARLLRECGRLKPSGIQNAIEDLRRWYTPPKASPPESSTAPKSPDLSDPDFDEESFDDFNEDFEDEPPLYERPVYQSPVYQPPVETIRNTTQKVGRNEPCPCGSGKKYKKCCGAT